MNVGRYPLLLVVSTGRYHASAFTAAAPRPFALANRPSGERTATRPSHGLAALPTADEVSTDDFMKQLGHASNIIPLLHPAGDDNEVESTSLLEVLSRQFGHSDGVRGFFAVYLTSPESLTKEEVPTILAEAVLGADPKVMVPLACMNVVMPTAMRTIHQDAELRECASKTASNGKRILRLLKGKEDVVRNCRAIRRVCRGSGGDFEENTSKDLIEYWEKFFVNYKYKGEQKDDIMMVVSEFC
mmetsp:Transcript_50369/g.107274  ORF Transcript_50369/g.107274 Transcript_50369/m.107274 type:complete len:243 (+) Transcript_50369:128-856(+)|eukprot:CAMPEP_0172544244 /NCGR_PEP_ID=MMETSP1067-20121228/14442_1 /TAXON_ID=265564 ORGANISM="Thalassiosira punctigera, Strain Tpunct2005C2" /NCGR_SAMPLE_ID=MMETSP1067 /ASSEMBLY_ACC=CAM_ASM_000444 /LENGTH=242 /DNA_ID=CAMNT_0013330773 /DNA_START=469 /DNA_END=1197 /DNA_ORIENTATION=+